MPHNVPFNKTHKILKHCVCLSCAWIFLLFFFSACFIFVSQSCSFFPQLYSFFPDLCPIIFFISFEKPLCYPNVDLIFDSFSWCYHTLAHSVQNQVSVGSRVPPRGGCLALVRSDGRHRPPRAQQCPPVRRVLVVTHSKYRISHDTRVGFQ
jgi:hypothetical protein